MEIKAQTLEAEVVVDGQIVVQVKGIMDLTQPKKFPIRILKIKGEMGLINALDFSDSSDLFRRLAEIGKGRGFYYISTRIKAYERVNGYGINEEEVR